MASIYVYETVRITGTFTDDNGTAADPDTITICVEDPSSNVTTYTYALAEITKSGTGIYYVDVVVDEAGRWNAWVKGSGTVTTIEKRWFDVISSITELAS